MVLRSIWSIGFLDLSRSIISDMNIHSNIFPGYPNTVSGGSDTKGMFGNSMFQ